MTAPPPIPSIAPTAALLTPEHLHQLTHARLACQKIRRAISFGTFDAWSIAIFAGLSCICGLSSISSLMMGSAMAVIAIVEFNGVSRLRRLDPAAPRMLGLNQLAFAAVLILYAVACLLSPSASPFASLHSADPAVASMLKPFESLTSLLTQLVYGTLIAVAIFAQGGAALYYFTRAKHLNAYLTQTPCWILQMQQAGMMI